MLGDFAHVYMYAQRTADDRIAIGGRGVPYRFGSKADTDGVTPAATVRKLSAIMQRFATGASTSRTRGRACSGCRATGRATVGLDSETGIAWAGGYVGTGVTATNLAGRTLTDLILERETDLTMLSWVNHRVREWEPEPLRWVATHGLYAAYGVADAAERRGRARTSRIARIADVVTGRG